MEKNNIFTKNKQGSGKWRSQKLKRGLELLMASFIHM